MLFIERILEQFIYLFIFFYLRSENISNKFKKILKLVYFHGSELFHYLLLERMRHPGRASTYPPLLNTTIS